jgi:hypothetical protein
MADQEPRRSRRSVAPHPPERVSLWSGSFVPPWELAQTEVKISSRGIPAFHLTRHSTWPRATHRRGPIDLGDDRRRVLGEKAPDPRQRGHEVVGEFRKGRGADEDEQHHAVPHHRVPLVRPVANAPVVRKRDPAMRANVGKPHLVGSFRIEMVVVALGRFSENLGEPLAEIAIGKEDLRPPVHR